MLWVPQKGIIRTESNVTAGGAASPGTSVSTSGSASVKGTPAELISSTSFDSYWMTIIATGYAFATTASQGSIDILIGASTEEVLIADLLMGYCGFMGSDSAKGPKRWDFPLYIPAGQRLSVQAAGARVSTALVVAIYLHGGSGMPYGRVGTSVTTYGITTVPDGTAITPGATGAAGSWTEITSATSKAHFAFVPSFQLTGDTTTNNRNLQVDMGIGAATEEQIGPSYEFSSSSGEVVNGPHNTFPTYHDVPSGTRLVMRASNSAGNDGAYNGVIHAVS